MCLAMATTEHKIIITHGGRFISQVPTAIRYGHELGDVQLGPLLPPRALFEHHVPQGLASVEVAHLLHHVEVPQHFGR